MKYNDFCLPQNWEAIAKAYSQTLKGKGFAFIRTDDNQAQKIAFVNSFARNLFEVLQLYKQGQSKTKGIKREVLEKLVSHTQNTLTQLKSIYPFLTMAEPSVYRFHIFSFLFEVISKEAQITKDALLLLEQEDAPAKKLLIKNHLLQRLEIFESFKNM